MTNQKEANIGWRSEPGAGKPGKQKQAEGGRRPRPKGRARRIYLRTVRWNMVQIQKQWFAGRTTTIPIYCNSNNGGVVYSISWIHRNRNRIRIHIVRLESSQTESFCSWELPPNHLDLAAPCHATLASRLLLRRSQPIPAPNDDRTSAFYSKS